MTTPHDEASSSSSPDFLLEVRRDDSAIVVVVTGDIDVATAPQLRDALHRAAADSTEVVVDLAGMDFIDSAGLGVLVGTLKRVKEREGSLVLRGLRPGPRRVLEITGLDDVFTMQED